MIEVRHLDADSYTPWAALMLDTFGGDGGDLEAIAQIRSEVDLERCWGAYDGPLVVGTAGSVSVALTLPFGGRTPLAAVTAVTVRATHRRRGIMTQLMQRQLTEFHARGECLAALWASEAAIYARFGYGLGTYGARLLIRREGSAFRCSCPVKQVVEIDRDAARRTLPMLQAEAASGQPGFVIRNQQLWQEAFSDPPAWRHGAGRQHFMLHQQGERPDGYVCYRTRRQRGPNGENESSLEVLELHALTPEAYATLWRYCLDVDLIAQVEARNRSVDEPLRHLLLDARALQIRAADGLWLRLVDVGRALERRAYAAGGELVMDVVDEFCPWNTGRVLLTAEGEGARVTPTGREPDLVLEAGSLAGLYLGANRAVTLRRAGRLEERRPGAAERADRLFAADATPWCPTGF